MVQCPLTYDQEAVQVFISTLRTNAAAGRSHHAARPTGNRPWSRLAPPRRPDMAAAVPRATALVVVSDGEDFGENLEPVLRVLGRTGARVYTVGVGTGRGSETSRNPAGALYWMVTAKPCKAACAKGPCCNWPPKPAGQYVER